MTWVANVLIVIGMLMLGSKRRSAFLWTIAGEAIWAVVGVLRGEWDIASICIVFFVIATVNYFRWKPEEPCCT